MPPGGEHPPDARVHDLGVGADRAVPDAGRSDLRDIDAAPDARPDAAVLPPRDALANDTGAPAVDTGPRSDTPVTTDVASADADSADPDTSAPTDVTPPPDARPARDAAPADVARPPDVEPEPDAMRPDVATPDARPQPDAEPRPDMARPDAATPDAGPILDVVRPDVAIPDVARPDAPPAPDDALPDASPPDAARPPDAALPDASPPDAARPPDAALPDASPPDVARPPDAVVPDAVPLPDASPPDIAPIPDRALPDAEPVPDVPSPDSEPVPDVAPPDAAPVPDVSPPDIRRVPDVAPPDASPPDSAPDAAPPDAAARPDDAAPDAAWDIRLVITPDAEPDAAPDAVPDATPEPDAQPPDAAPMPDAATPDVGCVDEICDGLDNDCDGEIDEGFRLGEACVAGIGGCRRFGETVCGATGRLACNAVRGDPEPETCNGVDDDCDTLTDEGADAEGNPIFPLTGECYDGPPGTAGIAHCVAGFHVCEEGAWSPCVDQALPNPEICDDADNNCNALIDDLDEGACICRPGEEQNCYTGPDGTADVGYCESGLSQCLEDRTAFGECVGEVLPELEICDDVDNDCDGEVDNIAVGACVCRPDESRACYTGPPEATDVGVCVSGVQVCVEDRTAFGRCEGDVMPSVEICDDADNDCDGVVDNLLAGACVCRPDEVRACYNGPDGTNDVGPCHEGSQICREDRTAFEPCDGEVLPDVEHCDDVDNDCDGEIDNLLEGACICRPEETRACYTGPDGTLDVGPCASGSQICLESRTDFGECVGDSLPGDEVCDDIDNDCDGVTDNLLEGECVCHPDETLLCYSGPEDTVDIGMCVAGERICQPDRTEFGPCEGEVPPGDESCNGLDDDCNGVIDDVPNPDGVPVAAVEGRISLPLSTSQDPDVAWSGALYGAVWREQVDPDHDVIEFMRANADGQTLSEPLALSSGESAAYAPSITWSGTEFGVVWYDARHGSPNSEIYFARASTEGVRIGDEVRLTDAPQISAAPHIVWTGTQYGVTWYDMRDGRCCEIYFARVAANGAIVGAPLRITQDPRISAAPQVVWTGEAFAIIWLESKLGRPTVFSTMVSADGSEVGLEQRVSVHAGNAASPSAVWADGEIGIAWAGRDGVDKWMYFVRLDADGTKIGDELPVAAVANSSTIPDLVWDGQAYGLVWADNLGAPTGADLFFRRITREGVLIGETVQILGAMRDSVTPALDWTGTEFGAIWQDSRSNFREIYFTHGGFGCP